MKTIEELIVHAMEEAEKERTLWERIRKSEKVETVAVRILRKWQTALRSSSKNNEELSDQYLRSAKRALEIANEEFQTTVTIEQAIEKLEKQ